jgi:hypothetical protein
MLSVNLNCDISLTIKLKNQKICTAVYAVYAVLLMLKPGSVEPTLMTFSVATL